ncbi:MAG TPA: hypothetical protein DCR60_07765 [Psychrobacter sp.]|nr:hypothetical protein [Psychrobacter sp.]|tara:strand:- start:1200 stop:1412 length:213 start_codon:yes stop_codon:yes gene_type:complete
MIIDTGASLRIAQAKENITASQLAKAFDVYPQQVMRWRNGNDIKVSLAIRFSVFFKMTLSEFILLGAKNV